MFREYMGLYDLNVQVACLVSGIPLMVYMYNTKTLLVVMMMVWARVCISKIKLVS